MVKHGGSHGLAVLVCTLSSGFIVGMIRSYMPDLLAAFNRLALFLCEHFKLPFPPQSAVLLLVATLMAFIWGAAFSLLHSDP